MCEKLAALKLGRKFVRDERMKKEMEGRDIKVRPCSQIRCSELSSVDIRIRDV